MICPAFCPAFVPTLYRRIAIPSKGCPMVPTSQPFRVKSYILIDTITPYIHSPLLGLKGGTQGQTIYTNTFMGIKGGTNMGQNMGQKKGGINELKYFKQKNLTEGSLLNEEPELLTNEHEVHMKRIENSELMSKSKVARLFAPLPKAEGNALENKTNKKL